jgi:hypothetical protein
MSFWCLQFSQKMNENNSTWGTIVKVSKSWKQILKFSFEPKKEQKYFCISALASKMGQIIKVMAHYKVSLLGVDSLWGDCMFIPADGGGGGHSSRFVLFCSFW